MKSITLLLLSLVLLVSTNTQASDKLTEEQLKQITTQFIAAKNARQQPKAYESDIDHFLSFIADEFVDEHVAFGVTVTNKAELRTGMVEKLKDDIHFSNMEIVEMMFGKNVVFVKYQEHVKGQPSHLDKVIEYSATNIMSLEFNNKGLIKHIRRHHGL